MIDIVVSGRNIEVPEDLREYAQQKLGRLDRYLDNIMELRVEMSAPKTKSAADRQVVQATLVAGGTLLRAEERSADMYAAIDAVADKLFRQVRRYKDRLQRKGRVRGDRPAALAAEIEMDTEYALDEEEEGEFTFERVKRFDLRPMSSSEAVEQMELLGHDFFAFLNSDTEEVNVAYRRTETGYGLLELVLP
ncbi:MAG: ribosome-associated translation inhibitor RaiA [Chloroflexi bacterium]|nr:ribosome-associated translation inhibitor RaiA [Chloroflexota bacterium]MBU1748277.1 ribosome-associated translation inhibitor RaiA [Chloroflexota bacterium]